MQDLENKDKTSGTDDWMFDNPFMNKVPTKGGGYKEMPRPTSIIPEPVAKTVSEKELNIDPYEITEADFYKSLTPSDLQEPGWRTPTEFPCCPKEVTSDGLKEYEDNLKPDLVFTSNQYGKYYMIDRAIDPKRNVLFVLSTNKEGEGYFGRHRILVRDP